MKKVLSLAIATVFAIGVSAQTTTAVKNQNEGQKVEKATPAKPATSTTPAKKSEEQIKKNGGTEASTAMPAKEHKSETAKHDDNSKKHKEHHADSKKPKATHDVSQEKKPSPEHKDVKAAPATK